jgi:hypothetical protein
MKQGDGTTVWGNGKIVFVLYPQVYTDFVFELHKHHQDLIRAMELAQVSIQDGSALDFLNTFLGTEVKKDTPMEVGFASLLDALKMRSTTAASQAAMERVAKQFKNHSMFPARSDPSKPLFDDDGSKQ